MRSGGTRCEIVDIPLEVKVRRISMLVILLGRCGDT